MRPRHDCGHRDAPDPSVRIDDRPSRRDQGRSTPPTCRARVASAGAGSCRDEHAVTLLPNDERNADEECFLAHRWSLLSWLGDAGPATCLPTWHQACASPFRTWGRDLVVGTEWPGGKPPGAQPKLSPALLPFDGRSGPGGGA